MAQSVVSFFTIVSVSVWKLGGGSQEGLKHNAVIGVQTVSRQKVDLCFIGDQCIMLGLKAKTMVDNI